MTPVGSPVTRLEKILDRLNAVAAPQGGLTLDQAAALSVALEGVLRDLQPQLLPDEWPAWEDVAFATEAYDDPRGWAELKSKSRTQRPNGKANTPPVPRPARQAWQAKAVRWK